VTTQGRNRQDRLHIDARQDGRGNAYYWIAYVRRRTMPPPDGSDISALAANRIAVTPLRLDMTDDPFMTRLAELFDQTAQEGREEKAGIDLRSGEPKSP
jgi:5'-nucleotidase